MIYPLVVELAADGIPVTVTCRVLKLAHQPFYRCLKRPVTDRDLAEAYRANALFDAHRDDPEFGHRLLADEARDAGEAMADRTAWRIASSNGWWSVFGKRKARGRGKKAGPPVHDDLVQREFVADAPNRLWLTDITEHRTGEGKLYLCAIKDVYSSKIVGYYSSKIVGYYSSKIVGYSIDSRMKSRLVVNAINNAAALRGDVAGCVVHSDRGSQFRSRRRVASAALRRRGSLGSIRSGGPMAKAPAMSPSDMPVDEVLDRVAAPRRAEADALLALFGDVTGERPVVWAGRIIGFGEYEYRYESGHSGHAPLLAFATGSTKHTVYLTPDFSERWPELLAVLGKHTASKACLYLTRLTGVDLEVLRALLEESLADTRASLP